MRKQTKLVAVLSAAALLAIGASMTSFAATPHWDQEDGEWVYLDRNGDKVTGEWKKSNGQWYYLDEDGYMAKDALIEYNDNRYYVDENGVKVTNAWVSMDNDDFLDNDEISTVWFYFDGKGKATGAGKDSETIKSIAYGDGQKGYFIFNTDGIMLTGWQKREKTNGKYDLYYLGDENEGWARTGWNYLDTDDEYFDGGDEEGEPYDDEEWFWFGSDGKAKRNGPKQINGKWYDFDENGVMLDLWVYGNGSDSNVSKASGSSISMATGSNDEKARYHVEDNGAREKNWIWAYANNGYSDYDDDMYWFYLDNKGRPTLADPNNSDEPVWSDPFNRIAADDTIILNGHNYGVKIDGGDEFVLIAKSIKNKTYIFDDAGRMQSGLFAIFNVDRGTSKNALNGYYYFTDDSSHGSTDGQMVTNKKMTIEINGEDKSYYFDKSGRAYTDTIISSSFYDPDGALVDAYGDGSTYAAIDYTDAVNAGYTVYEKGKKEAIDLDPVYVTGYSKNSNDLYTILLLNGNGKIKKNGTVTDMDGYKVTVQNYKVTKIEDKN